MSAPPLTDTRVVDLTQSLAGPLTTMHLGDLGADVVKIEPPAGDEWRRHERIPGQGDRSRHHMQANRNKRSLCLDLTHSDAREALRDLIARADVLVTNMRPGVAETLGFGWDDCRRLNPGLVYCDITAFGTGGPRGGRAGYDLQAQGMAGFMTGPDRDEPVASAIPITDTALPLIACTAILAALIERGRSGRGQRVEATILGTAVALNAHSLVRVESLPGHGVSTFSRAFFRPYRTADGWITVAAYAERMAHRFCDAVGLGGLLDAPPWDDRAARSARSDELVALFAPRMRARSTAGWDETLTLAGVPAAPVQERDALFDDPQVRAMGLLEEMDDAEVGPILMTAPVVRLTDTPGAIRFVGRHLGEDTEEVLAELGRGPAEIAALVAAGAAVAFRGREQHDPREEGAR